MNNSVLYKTKDWQTEAREKFDAQHTEFQSSAEKDCRRFKFYTTQYTPLWLEFNRREMIYKWIVGIKEDEK